MKYHHSSYFYMLHLLTLVLVYFLQDQSCQVLLAQVRTQVCQVLICITHQICQDSVIDGVGFPSFLLIITLLKLQLRSIDLESFHAISKSWVLVTCSSNTDDLRIEIHDKFFDLFTSISIGINRYEDSLEVEEVGFLAFFNLSNCPAQFGQGIGADIWAVCEPKIDKVVFSFQIFRTERFVTCIKKRPVSSDFSLTYTRCFSVDSCLATLLFVSSDNLYFHIGIGHSQGDGTDDKHGISELCRLHTLLFGYFKLIARLFLIDRFHLPLHHRFITRQWFVRFDRTLLLFGEVKHVLLEVIYFIIAYYWRVAESSELGHYSRNFCYHPTSVYNYNCEHPIITISYSVPPHQFYTFYTFKVVVCCVILMKVIESLLGFKQKKTPILQQRNSIFKLLLIINLPNIILLYLVNRIQPDIYMDEEFHYRQFSYYNQNHFDKWEPKLTTPPGLYLIQRLIATVLPADLSVMRTFNSLFFSNVFIVYVLKIYDLIEVCPNNISRALNLALTPTIYFFNFLDYTDSASVCLIAVMFYYNLTKSEWRLGFASLIAVFVRQNNLIWIIYLIIYRVLNDNKKQILVPKSLPSHFVTIVKILFNSKWQIISQSRFQILVVLAFLGFLKVYNKGNLVFGDHKHHVMTFHPNQLLYLSLFCFCNLPITLGEYISSITAFFQRIYISRHSLAAYLFILSVSIICVQKYTLIHPFIVDDNRHYTFYIYRYVLKHNIFKFSLCLAYAFAFHFLFKQIVNSQLKLIKFILWLGASSLYLSFSQLVEFRYFAIPFILYCFELQNKNFNLDVQGVHRDQNRYTAQEKMIWTTLIKVGINFIVFGVFFFYEFNNQYGYGRIMW